MFMSSCATPGSQAVVTRTVEVEVPVIQKLPADWTVDCTVEPVDNPQSNGQLLEAIYNLLESTEDCNIRMDKIRKAQLEGTLK